MNRPSDERPHEPDIEWLAFQYAAGELSDPEAAAVEQRMAHDQAMREAVSRAVALGRELAAARTVEAEVVPARIEHRKNFRASALRRLARASLGLAASIALLAGAYLAGRGSHTARARPERVASGGASASEAEASAWLAVRRAGDSTAQLERELADWEPGEVAEPRINPTPALPQGLIDMALAANGKEEHD